MYRLPDACFHTIATLHVLFYFHGKDSSMYQFFTRTYSDNRPVSHPAGYRLTRRQLQVNGVKAIRWYRYSKSALSNRHLLVSVLKSLRIDPTVDVFEIHRLLINRYRQVALAHGITTVHQVGAIEKTGVFFKGNVNEILFTVNEDFDLLRSSQPEVWQSLTPIRFLRHPIDDTTVVLPDGTYTPVSSGVAVVQIDMVKLGIQFYHWYRSLADRDLPFYETVRQFLVAYPMANALKSFQDVAHLNRFLTLLNGEKPNKEPVSLPTPMLQVDSDVNAYMFNQMLFLTKKSYSFDVFLMNLQPVHAKDYLQLMKMPDTFVPRQLAWVFSTAVIPALRIVLRLDGDSPGDASRDDKIEIRRLIREALIDRSLPRFVKDEISAFITPYVTT